MFWECGLCPAQIAGSVDRGSAFFSMSPRGVMASTLGRTCVAHSSRSGSECLSHIVVRRRQAL